MVKSAVCQVVMLVSGRHCLFCTDQRGTSEVMGTFMSVALTVLLFSIIAAVVLGLGGTNPTASAYVQGDVYPSSNYLVLSHAGGDSIPVSSLQVRVFVNESQAYEPDFTLLTQGYTQDTDGVWSYGDRLLLEQNISAGSTVEVVVIDERTKNVVGNADLVFREGQVPPTTGSPTTIPTTLTTTMETSAPPTTTTTVTATTTPSYPECIEIDEQSAQATGSSYNNVEFMLYTHPASHLRQVTVVWITNGTYYACTLDQITIDRPGKDCYIVGMSGCGAMNATSSCTLPSNHDMMVTLEDFRDANGQPIDMRGATIALAIETRCQGSDYFFESALIHVPGP